MPSDQTSLLTEETKPQPELKNVDKADETVNSEIKQALKDDAAPICYNCGNQTQRAGSCYVCSSCGSTTGCS